MELLYKIHSFFLQKAYAAGLGDELTTRIGDIENTEANLDDPAGPLVEMIIQIAVPLAVVCLIVLVAYASYMLISSQGNPDKLKEGKEVLTNAIIGFLVILLSVAILLIVAGTLGLDIAVYK